jgi:hypothetical protein
MRYFSNIYIFCDFEYHFHNNIFAVFINRTNFITSECLLSEESDVNITYLVASNPRNKLNFEICQDFNFSL